MKTLVLSTLAALGCALAMTAPPARSAEAPATQTNPSGQSKGEIKAQREFKMLDVNGDGKLSRGEIRLFPRLDAAFDRADTDRDGFVSMASARLRHHLPCRTCPPAVGAGHAAHPKKLHLDQITLFSACRRASVGRWQEMAENLSQKRHHRFIENSFMLLF
jgi:hypothetical protein